MVLLAGCAVLTALHAQKGPINWAGLAIDAGYFDQAHMIGEFKACAGLTPGDYAAQGIEAPGFVPLQ